MREPFPVCSDRLDEEIKRILSLHNAGPSNGQESSGERLAVFGLISETDFPPLDCGSDSSLSGVVGGFHALMVKEGEQVVPMFEETSGGTCHIMIRGQLVGLQTIADSCPDGDRFRDKGPPVNIPVFEGMPEGKQAPDFREHPSCEPYAIGAPARMFEPFEIPDDMRPTDLPPSLVVGVVGREHVRTDDAVKNVAKDSLEHLCSPGGCQSEERHGRGHENPKPDSLAHALPTRLIDVEDVLLGQSLFDFLTAWFKRFGYFLMKLAYRAKRDVHSEKGPSKLLTPSSGYPMHGGKIGQKSGKPGTEAGSGLRRDIRPGDIAAVALDTTQPVFADIRFDVGNFYHLTPKVGAEHAAAVHVRVKRFVTLLTRLGKDLFDQENLLRWNQIPVCPFVTWLSSRLAMPGFLALSHFWFACRAIRRRRLGGIGRILGEKGYFPFQFSHLRCEKIHRAAQLQQDFYDDFSVAVRNGYGFVPSHGESQYQVPSRWQEQSENRRDMARLSGTLNSNLGSPDSKMGGPTHSAR